MNEALESAGASAAATRESQLRRLGPLLSFAAPLVRQAWPIVAFRLAAGSAALAAGIFLLAQISAAASAEKPLVFSGVALLVASVVCLSKAALPLLGVLTVDSNGVRLTPRPLGFHADWNELASWQANPVRRGDSAFPAIEFRRHAGPTALALPQAWISERDQGELVRVLRSIAPDLERSPLGGDDPLGYSRFRRSVKPV
jgi:hypothetical protein